MASDVSPVAAAAPNQSGMNRPDSGANVPPPYAHGDYVEAGDGWWAHKGGQWLFNPTDRAYFHLPSGQLQLAPADGLLVHFNAAVHAAGASDTADASVAPVDSDKADAAAATQVAPLRGTVRWFNGAKGFGFIEPRGASGGKSGDIFFHRNQIVELEDEAVIAAGSAVTFFMGETDVGRSCAVNVRLVPNDSEAGAPSAKRARRDGGDMEADGDGETDSESASSVEVDVEADLRSAVSSEKGPSKDRCEDFSVNKVKLPIGVLGESATCIFFAVFDGHGGSSCAEYATAHLAKNILSRLRDRPKDVSDEVFLKGGLIGGFKQTEHNFLQHARRVEDRSGCTACTMTVFGPDEEARLRLFFANVGDSRAVLARVSGEAVRMTTDHKPNLPEEKKRIEAAGGGVAEVANIWRCMLPRNRVSPILGLAVSRALGDKDFKNPDIVSADPEITIHEVDWEDDEFVILASDGIWDVISDRDAVRLVQEVFRVGGDEEKAAQILTSKALEKGTADDRTALVVRFGWCQKAPATSVQSAVAVQLGAEDESAASAPPGSSGALVDGSGAASAAQGRIGSAGPDVVEEEEDENDPEVREAIRAAMGFDDDDEMCEGEEEEDGERDAEVSVDVPAKDKEPMSAATACMPSDAVAEAQMAELPNAGLPAAAASRAAEGAVADAMAGRCGKSTGAPSSPPPAPAGAVEADLDDIFAGGHDDNDGEAPVAGAQAPFSGSKAVGMGLFDLPLPAPAEDQGPALVGPRRPRQE